MFFYDATYILVIIGVLLCMVASQNVRGTFNRYAKVRTGSGITGAQAAERILRQAGIYGISIQHVSGSLTDHYDASSKVLRLSDSVYNSNSIAAVSVAAHECGHALQDNEAYVPLRLRAALVPVTNFGAAVSWPLVLLGIILGGNDLLINIGIVLFLAVLVFHIVTLPVEFNASNRALHILSESGILYGDENKAAGKVLKAAALTYVASVASTVLQLLRLLLLTRSFRNDD